MTRRVTQTTMQTSGPHDGLQERRRDDDRTSVSGGQRQGKLNGGLRRRLQIKLDMEAPPWVSGADRAASTLDPRGTALWRKRGSGRRRMRRSATREAAEERHGA